MPESTCADQSEAFAFLGNPATHGLSEPVLRIDTHCAAVFLAGKDVYKVKKAVLFPFMDFSTLEKRRLACERELEVNKANAPDLYLGVVPITRDPSGFKLGGRGEIVEWAVHLRRFDENRTLDKLADRGELTPGLIAKLAGTVADSHRRAHSVARANASRSLKWQIDETLASIAKAPHVFPPPGVRPSATLCAEPLCAASRSLRSGKTRVRRDAATAIFICATSL